MPPPPKGIRVHHAVDREVLILPSTRRMGGWVAVLPGSLALVLGLVAAWSLQSWWPVLAAVCGGALLAGAATLQDAVMSRMHPYPVVLQSTGFIADGLVFEWDSVRRISRPRGTGGVLVEAAGGAALHLGERLPDAASQWLLERLTAARVAATSGTPVPRSGLDAVRGHGRTRS